MRTMSFNVLYGGNGVRSRKFRETRVIRAINDCRPDTFGVQEATKEWMDALIAAFPGYAFEGMGRRNGKNKGEFCAVFYDARKFEKIDSGSFWLSRHPWQRGRGWDAVLPRTCSWVILEDKENGNIFAHFNTHLDHKGKKAKVNGIRLILEKIDVICGEEMPVILTGDFNANPSSEVYAVMEESAFSDARTAARESSDSPTYHGIDIPNYAGSVIDYIYVREAQVKRFEVFTEKIDDAFPSDHYPIFADVEP